MPIRLPSDPKGSAFYLKGYYDAKLDYEAKQPSAEKTGKWIPVSERKPEVEQLVWLYTKDNAEPYNVFVGYLNEHGWWVECGVNYSEYSPPCIVAWQPLNKPEPYKGQTNCGARMVEE